MDKEIPSAITLDSDWAGRWVVEDVGPGSARVRQEGTVSPAIRVLVKTVAGHDPAETFAVAQFIADALNASQGR